MSLQSYNEYEKKRMKKNALYKYAVRLPRGLMTPLFLKTTLRVKWVQSLLRNSSFSILLILIDIGVNQEETNCMEFPGAAYLRKIESFMEDHYISVNEILS